MTGPKLSNYLMVAEASEVLGVSQNTLRKWADDGKVKTRRHPINGYRLFERSDLEKLLKSAVANAQQKDGDLDVDDLVVARAAVDPAPPMKRIRHRAMGRVFQIIKRSCHVTIDLDVPTRMRPDR